MFENTEMLAFAGTIIVALAAVIAGGAGWLVKKIDVAVGATATTIDDKVWRAVKDGLRESLDDLQREAQAEIDKENSA